MLGEIKIAAKFHSVSPMLHAKDVEDLGSWYAQVFTAKVFYFPEDRPYTFMQVFIGPVCLMFSKQETPVQHQGDECQCFIQVSGVVALYEMLLPVAKIIEPLRQMPWKNTEFVVEDPAGNRLVFSQEPTT